MSYPFGITGIGNNPYMSGLGMYGLPGNSTYSSFYNPSFMGFGGMGMAGLGMSGMMGMYPAYMKQMNDVYQDMEKSQLAHSGAMHNLLLENKTNAYKAEDAAMFEKAMADHGLQTSIVNLAEKIRAHDSDGICQEYDKIKCSLYQKFNKYFKENPNEDPAKSVRQVIESMYAEIISKKSGETVSLRSDIERFGETALMHGFNEKFFGNKDYHKKYTEEALSYVYGTSIDNKGGKDRMQKIGGIGGRAAEGATVAAAGYGAGLSLAAIGACLSSNVRKFLGTDYVRDEAGKIIKENGKKLKACTFENGLKKAAKYSKWAALLALGADVVWQFSRD